MTALESLRSQIAAALATCTDTAPAALPYRAAVERWLAGEPADTSLPHPDTYRDEPGFASDPALALYQSLADTEEEAHTYDGSLRDSLRAAASLGLSWGAYARLERRHSLARRALEHYTTHGPTEAAERAAAEVAETRTALGWG